MSLAALLQRRAVTPITSSVTTDVTVPGRAVAEGYAGYVGYAENSKGEAKTDDVPLKACAPIAIGRLSVDENRQRRTIEIEVSGVTGVTANAGVERHHTWLIALPTGERFSSMFCPPLSLAEVQARYPGASLTPEPDRPARPIAPATLAVIHAWLDHIGEDDAQTRREFVEGLARDPEQLRLCIEDAIAAGLAEWDRPQVETDEPTEVSSASKAVCSRCAHWTPDRINPAGGLGRCTIAAPASKRPGSLWPWLEAEIHCTRFQETNS
ncbi:MAG: hypothetical protein MZV65_26360 [Chromatiales bacterium]|nr:hypothetical protein [Chromatiales bacterium]